MKIMVQGVPEFTWSPTTEHLAALSQLSTRHYDAVCRAASAGGGFIFGWSNQLSYYQEGDDPVRCRGSFRDFDTCLKIMEHPHMVFQAGSSEMSLVREMRQAFNTALTRGNKLYETWKDTVEA